MSGRGSYSQKKKREAVRILSQQHSRPSIRARPSAAVEPGRRRKSAEKRQRGDDDEAGQRTRRDDGKRYVSPMNNPVLAPPSNAPSTAASSSSPFGKPTVSAEAQKPSSNLFSRAGSDASVGEAATNIFAQGSSSAFGSQGEAPSNLFQQTSASTAFGSQGGAPSNLFQQTSASTANPFQSSVFGSLGAGSGETRTPVFGQVSPQKHSTRLTVTVGQGGSDDAGTGRAIQSGDSAPESRHVVQRDPSTGEIPRSGSVFGRLSPAVDAQEQASSAGLFGKPVISTGDKSATTGLFGKPLESQEKASPTGLFGKPVDSQEKPVASGLFGKSITGDQKFTVGLFGKPADTEEKAASTGLFGKPATFGSSNTTTKSSGAVQRGSPRKEGASKIFQEPAGTTSRSPLTRDVVTRGRQLTTFDDAFDSDISDLETFGSSAPVVKREVKVEKESRREREVVQGRAPVKRTGLFGRALEDAAGGGRERDAKRWREGDRSREFIKETQKPVATFATKSDIMKLTTIICKDVSDELNNRQYLTKFFEKFGLVKKVSVNPKKTMATIYFEDHDSAARAKKEVKRLGPGTKPVTIFWGQRDKSKERSKSRQDENAPPPSQVKSEVLVSEPIKRSLSPAPVVTLSGLGTKSFYSAHERYEALEERDKQIRKGITKQIDLATAKKMKGTCQDMCPEKERYMREHQRRLSPYEIVPGTEKGGENPVVDHQRAVKEYSRSSADQEEPLPSELREPRVLDMTMTYLMSEIMNREPSGGGGDGRSWSDWFDFLWNRTRSIRKEITQQQLCGTEAVGLMEKCARFHIYCSYRLCEEDRMTFDPKINNENLTKSLQSLKQFYHDLASEGVFCPNEAEFRAYEVLLNLTGGDILREVQQYRPEVRNSESVVFALKVSAAFSSNNYCRFFKLIRTASFLNACILHRYFLQLRSTALDTMNKAFTTAKGTSQYPTSELVDLLAFENEEQASFFCECHGLAVTDGAIHFSRPSFFYPEEALLPQRAPSVIEAKNDRSVGEVVNGSPLPIIPLHVPISSFDDEGRLVSKTAQPSQTVVKPQERKIEVIRSPEMGQELETEQKPPLQESLKQEVTLQQQVEEKQRITNEMIKDVTKELFLEVIDEMVQQLAIKFVDALAVIKTSPVILDQVLSEEVQHLCHLVSMETVKEERYLDEKRREEERIKAEEARKREREKNQLLDLASRQINESIIREVVDESLKAIMHQEISLYRSQLRQESIQRCTAIVTQEILFEVVGSEVNVVSREVISAAIAEREQRLADIEAAINLRQLSNCFQKWKRVQSKRAKIRRALETFPAGPPNQDQAEQLRMLWPSRQPSTSDEAEKERQSLPLCLDTPYSVVSERESLAKHILHRHYLAYVRQQRAWQPVDLPTIHQDNNQLSQQLQNPDSRCRYWKLVASLPIKSRDNSTTCDWLKAKLRRGKISDEVRLKRLRDNKKVETLSLFTQRFSSHSVGICTKAVSGKVNENDVSFQLNGTSGIILGIHVPNEEAFEGWIHEANFRLDSILSSVPPKPCLPILICVMSDNDLSADKMSFIADKLGLAERVEENSVSSWRILWMPTDVVNEQALLQLEEGLAWLAVHQPQRPSTTSETVKEFLDSGLSRFFSTNVYQLAKMKRDTGQLPMQPQVIVDLYNSVITHLASVVSSPALADISWPPSEFASKHHPDLPAVEWNSSETLQYLWDAVQSLQLPQMPVSFGEDWKSVRDNAIEYVTSLPGQHRDKAPLFSRVRWLLDRSCRAFQSTCFMTFDTEDCEPTSHHAPWSDILEECVSYMIGSLGQSTDGDMSLLSDCQVHYLQSELNDFELPGSWLQEMNETMDETIKEQNGLQQSVIDVVSRQMSVKAEEEERERERRRSQREAELLPDNRSFLHPVGGASLVGGAKKKTSRLRKMLDKEREESERFDALLANLLEDPLEGLDPFLHIPVQPMESEFRLQLPPLPKASQLAEGQSQLATIPDAPAIVLNETDSGNTLSGQIKSLKERLAAEKQAALVAEMRLNAMLDL